MESGQARSLCKDQLRSKPYLAKICPALLVITGSRAQDQEAQGVKALETKGLVQSVALSLTSSATLGKLLTLSEPPFSQVKTCWSPCQTSWGCSECDMSVWLVVGIWNPQNTGGWLLPQITWACGKNAITI